MPYYFDSTILLMIPVMIFVLWAQANVKSTYAKYAKIATARGITGREAARCILDANGLRDIRIEATPGELTDHYDPKAGVIRLSEPVCDVNSAAAVGVAAHEAGHAVQHAVGYFPMQLRSMIIPVTQFGTRAAMPIFMIGLIAGLGFLVDIGLIFFFFSVLFQVVTLPCEFNASRRAIAALQASGSFSEDELTAARKVLNAAALTYVGALASALVSFLRLLIIAGRRNK